MKIFIISMEDPLYTLPFIKDIITARKNEIIGVAISKGGRFKIGKKRSKVVYAISLILIMGITGFFKNVFKTLKFKFQKKFSTILNIENPGLECFCAKKNINVFLIDSPNNKKFINVLNNLKPDVIINQSQYIIKKELLEIPKIGVINRHNALLPKNRGRLTPFWVLFKKENETGVSIHFVDEGMDSGAIIVQKKFQVENDDTFNSLVDKNYKLASIAMLEALKKLETGVYTTLPNLNELATYNNVPTFRDAIKFRFNI
ncbi:MAG: hypothetical protein LCH32_06580 [Bacteroidetes bacterium]|nr:hypothetical protein [Bacteroidota bacterium]